MRRQKTACRSDTSSRTYYLAATLHENSVGMVRIYLLVFSLLLIFASACVVVSTPPPASQASKPLPPGQAKKISGTRSAKPFAPGQQKKNH